MNTKKVLGGIGVLALAAFFAACSHADWRRGQQRQEHWFRRRRSARRRLFAVFGGGAGITNQGTATAITGDMGTTGASTMITGFHSSLFSYAETPLNIGAVSGSVYTDAPEGTVSTLPTQTRQPLMP